MAKDYEYYRMDFITQVHDLTTAIVAKSRTMTPIEGIVYFQLMYLQMTYGSVFLKIKSQFKIDDYTVDFFIEYTNKNINKKIVIECDGHEFHERTKEQASKDKKRDRTLTTKGFIIFRYSGSDIVNDPLTICKDITKILISDK